MIKSLSTLISEFLEKKNEKRPVKNKATLKILSLISQTFWGILFFNETISIGKLFFILLIVVGAIGLNLVTTSH